MISSVLSSQLTRSLARGTKIKTNIKLNFSPKIRPEHVLQTVLTLKSLGASNYGKRRYSYQLKKQNDEVMLDIPSSVIEAPRVIATQTNLKVGDKIHGYIIKAKKVSEVSQSVVYELEHIQTGAKHAHYESTLAQNAFCLAFRTFANDEKGIPTILSKILSCGSSENYPVRMAGEAEVFKGKSLMPASHTVQLLPDHLHMIFSTTNVRDYYNRMHITMNNAYWPKLSKSEFPEFSHRFQVIDDNNEDIMEQAGDAYLESYHHHLNAFSVFESAIYQNLYSGNDRFRFPSVGYPTKIKDASFEEVVEYHKDYFHPSNSYTVTIGDFPLEPQLEFLDSQFLSKFQKHSAPKFNSNVNKFYEMPSMNEPLTVKITGPVDNQFDSEHQGKVAIVWPCDPERTSNYSAELTLHDYFLTSMGKMSELAMNSQLVGSGLAKEVAVLSNSRYSGLVAHGVDQSKLDHVNALLLQSLEELASNQQNHNFISPISFEQHLLAISKDDEGWNSPAHQAYLAVAFWMVGNPPTKLLTMEEFESKLEALSAEGAFHQRMAKSYLDSKKRLHLYMISEEEYDKKMQKETERTTKNAMKTTYKTKKSRKELKDLDKIIHSRNQVESILSASSLYLPSLSLKELEQDLPQFPYIVAQKSNSFATIWTNINTELTSHIRIAIDISSLPENLLKFAPIWCYAISLVGTHQTPMTQFADFKASYLSEFSAKISHNIDLDDPSKFKTQIEMAMTSLGSRITEMFQILSSVLTNPQFDNIEHLESIVNFILSEEMDMMRKNPIAAAKIIAGSKIQNMHSLIKNHFFGQSLITTLRYLTTTGEAEASQQHQAEIRRKMVYLCHKLTAISKFILEHPNKIKIAINSTDTYWADIAEQLDRLSPIFSYSNVNGSVGNGIRESSTATSSSYFANAAPNTQSSKTVNHDTEFQNDEKSKILPNELLETGIPFAGVAQAFLTPSVNAAHEDIATLEIISKLATRMLQSQGGYAAQTRSAEIKDGILFFKTLVEDDVSSSSEAFTSAIRRLCNGEFDRQEILEAQVDAVNLRNWPWLPPSQQNYQFFSAGITPTMHQNMRMNMMRTTQDQIVHISRKYLAKSNARSAFGACGGHIRLPSEGSASPWINSDLKAAK